jgi:hypothetical protein
MIAVPDSHKRMDFTLAFTEGDGAKVNCTTNTKAAADNE